MNSAGTATTKPAIGPAMPMSNSMRLLGNRLADADERAERAGQREGNRQKERQRRVDVIIAAGKVVPQLVAAEDREDRPAVPEAAQEQRATAAAGSRALKVVEKLA